MIVLDACVWTSTLLNDDAHHFESVDWIVAWTAQDRAVSVPGVFLLTRQRHQADRYLQLTADGKRLTATDK